MLNLPHRFRRIIASLLLFGVVSGTMPSVSVLASSINESNESQTINSQTWTTKSDVFCGLGGSVGGSSWITWSGYWPWDGADSRGYLFFYRNGTWELRKTDFRAVSGGAGEARVDLFTDDDTGYWSELGEHHATFFSGTHTTNSGAEYCF